MQTGKNLPYKGDWLEIGPARRRGMNQNTLNTGWDLRWPIHFSPPIEWGKGAFSRMSTFDHGWYWTPKSGCWQGTEMGEVTPNRGIMLYPRGECRTKALRETGESDRLQMQTRRNWRDHAGLRPIHYPHDVNSARMSVTPGDSWLRRSSPLNLIPSYYSYSNYFLKFK